MSNILFLSDTHFNHLRVINYSARPYSSVEEMNEALIQNWNKMASPNDTVYHLGDFSFMKPQDSSKLIKRLRGKIHLILGNHDKDINKIVNDVGNSCFASIQHYKEVKINNLLFVLFHYGQRVWNKSHYGSIHLYGHSHGKLPPYGKSVDVGVDCKEITSEYRPVHLDEIISYMSKKEINGERNE